jgi:amino-acid N-acetyltransferase
MNQPRRPNSYQLHNLKTQRPTISVRKAIVDDVDGIARLVNTHALQGEILPRLTSAVYQSIDDWFIAIAGGEVLGCVSLLAYNSSLVEVRSLAVGDRFQGLGIGSRLMRALLAEVEYRRITTLFAMTRQVTFFERFGFRVSRRNLFPEKVWLDCLQCPLISSCNETAVVWESPDQADLII